jgi:CcmD family protein
MTPEEKYVAAAYLAVFLFVLLYVAIMAAKLQRLERELGELSERLRARERDEAGERDREEAPVG